LERRQTLETPLETLFPFFADAFNLERITPAFLNFRVLTPPPIEMGVGTLIDYRLRLRGVPIRWRTRIAEWDPPRRFADEQLRGPYLKWYHEHVFEPDGPRTLCIDRVTYRSPGPELLQRIMVRPDVERIFDHRQRVLAELFGEAASDRNDSDRAVNPPSAVGDSPVGASVGPAAEGRAP
jgi:ligand-binding SRPBCC domain-containing protein